MFWRLGGYANISTLDTILDKPDVTLEELLDESDLIQELKGQNAKLIEFLRQDNILERLLQYVVAPKSSEAAKPEGETDADERTTGGFFKSRSNAASKSRDSTSDSDQEKQELKRTKYSYVSCEILSSEVYSIHESLLANPAYLQEFWKYTSQPAPLDPVQAGYFTKVNEALLEKKTEDMIAFIKTIDNVVADMMRHVDCPMIMDLLLKLISLEKEPEGQGIVDWLQSQGLIPMLLSYITPTHPASTQTSAGDFLKAIITISANATGQDAAVIGPNELTRQLVSEPCIGGLVSEMLKGGNPLTVGVGIVIEVIRKNNSDYDSEAQIGPEPKSSDPIYLGTLLRIFADQIPKFMQLILSPKQNVATAAGMKTVERKDLKVAWGERIEPLGFDRFKTCELMAELLHCSNMGLLNEKGSDAAVRARDAERERLKEQGRLESAHHIQGQQTEFSGSVDSSGFHHPQDFTPLGESPESVKRLEVQNSADDEDFEKVSMPEASNDGNISGGVADLDIDNEEPLPDESKPLTHPPRTSSLSNAIAAEDKPAPLFSKPSGQEASENPATTEPPSQPQQPNDNPAGPSDVATTPVIEHEIDDASVVGDLLKVQFVNHRVVPTILDFFFRFPWNNFLHNVVYDVVQQVFNGSMDRGFNRSLAIDLFETGRITDRVIEGQQRSDKAQTEKKMRLGYMGHLTLIAEEVVKFTERQPAELLAPVVVDKVTSAEWIQYVEHTLTETRDRDNAILGGVRPDVAGGPRQAVLNAVNAAQGGLGNTGSSALANAGLIGNDSTALDSIDLANASGNTFGLGASSGLLSGFGSSDDEDDDEMEGVQPTKAEGAGQSRLSDEDQSTLALIDTGDAPSIPAPLAIAPSRARRQLAARLAEKKRLTDQEASADGAQDDPATATGPDFSKATGPSLPLADSHTLNIPRPSEGGLLGNDDDYDEEWHGKPRRNRSISQGLGALGAEGTAEDSESDSDSSNSDDGPSFGQAAQPLPQPTRITAPSQRLALDNESSSDEEEDETEDDDDDEASSEEDTTTKPPNSASKSPAKPIPTPSGTRHAPPRSSSEDDDEDDEEDEEDEEEEGELDITPDDGLQVEDYWRLGELRQAAAEQHRAAIEAGVPTSAMSSSSGKRPSPSKHASTGSLTAAAAAASSSAYPNTDAAPHRSASGHLRSRGGGSRGALGSRDPRAEPEGSRGHARGASMGSGSMSTTSAAAAAASAARLRAQWGLSTAVAGELLATDDDDDDDDDDEDAPVEMGTKYLSRRASLQGRGSSEGR